MDVQNAIVTESTLQKGPHKKTPVPWRLTALMMALAWVQFGMAWRAVRLPAELVAAVQLPMALDFVASVFWALTFAGVVWGLVRAWPQAKRAAGFVSVGFVIYSVVRLIVFTQAAYDRQRLPFLGLLALILIVLAWVTLLRKNGDVSNGNNARS